MKLKKTKIYAAAGAVALMALMPAFNSCDDTFNPEPQAKDGKVELRSMSVDVSNDMITIETGRSAGIKTGSRASVDIDVKPFLVKINKSTGTSVGSYTFGEMPEIVSLPAGDYTVEVESHEVKDAEWEHPYYKGSKSFKVEADKVTPIGAVSCKFASIKVTITFSELLSKYMTDDCKVTVVANDKGSLDFVKGEKRSGYFKALEGSSTLVAAFKGTVNGSQADARVVLTDVQPGTHRLIRFKMKGVPGQSGSINPGDGITIDQDIFEEDGNGTIKIDEENLGDDDKPGQEDPDPDKPDDPDKDLFTLTPTGMDLTGKVVDAKEGKDYVLGITSKNPLTNLKVKIISDYLTKEFLSGVGLTDEFDLAEPGVYKEGLAGFGFPIENGVKGQKDVVFNLTPFIPMLNLADDAMDHTFRLTIIDETGKEKTVDLKFHSDPAFRAS